MGQSTDAILFYGYCWTEETWKPWLIGKDEDEDEDEDWEERYAAKTGLTLPEGIDYTATEWSEAESLVYKSYLVKKSKLVEASQCIVGFHCSGECPMPYVAIKKSITTARRGYPKKIVSLSTESDWSWEKRIRDFCDFMDIPHAEIGWWLVSDWC